MPTQTANLRWGVEQRLEFIEFRLFWEGGVNRADITEEFGVSVPQASKDLSQYQDLAPSNMRYDRSKKRYFGSRNLKSKFFKPDSGNYLNSLVVAAGECGDYAGPMAIVGTLPIPTRKIDPNILRVFVNCARDQKSVEILYQSMNPSRPEPEWRRVSPHAFANDGFRWHARAFCHFDNKFKDFILSRCVDARVVSDQESAASVDELWSKNFAVHLAPNPKLSKPQQKIVALDFNMEDNQTTVSVRYALLYYFNKRLRLDVAHQMDEPGETPIVVKNKKAFDAALLEATK